MNDDIRRDFIRIDAATVQAASAYASSILADVAGRRGGLDGRIAALSPAMRVCGPAFTVAVRPGDNLMIHAAMAMAKPGDVLVIDGKADRTCALMGSIMLNACKQLAGSADAAAGHQQSNTRSQDLSVSAAPAHDQPRQSGVGPRLQAVDGRARPERTSPTTWAGTTRSVRIRVWSGLRRMRNTWLPCRS